jgi:hypothetical protein
MPEPPPPDGRFPTRSFDRDRAGRTTIVPSDLPTDAGIDIESPTATETKTK